MRRQPVRFRCGAPACLAIVSLMAYATASAGDLRVRVSGSTDEEPLAGATVSVDAPAADEATRTQRTDEKGATVFLDLPAGSYEVEVDFPGHSGVRFDEIEVPESGTRDLPVVLVPDLQEKVRVTGRRSPVELDETTNQTKFDDNFIESLPVRNRFLQNMITFAPGVLDSDEDGNPNVHGSRSGDFKLLIDGVSNTDPLTGEYLSYLNLEAVEEIEIITAGAGVEYGRAQGGFANVLQKQGSDEIEGVAGFIYRTDLLDGDGAAGIRKERIPEFEWIQPFFQLSGPLVRGKLWYRLSQEYIEREDPLTLLGDNLVTIRREQTISSNQITWQATPRNKLALNFLYDPLRIENIGVTSTIPVESSQTTERGGRTWTLAWQGQHSSRFLMDTLVAWQDHAFDTLPTERGVDNDCVYSERIGALAGAKCFYTNEGFTSGSYHVDSRDERQRFTVKTDGVWYPKGPSERGVRLKFGFIIENEKYLRDLERGMEVTWTTITVPITFFNPFGRIGSAVARFGVPRESTAEAKGTSWGAYVETQYQPRSNLVLTLGLRYDVESVDTGGFSEFDPEAESRQFLELLERGKSVAEAMRLTFTAYENIREFPALLKEALDTDARITLFPIHGVSSSWVNTRYPDTIDLRDGHLSPRATIAWDPTGDGKTKLALSAGRYYDKLPLAVPLVELEPVVASMRVTAFPIGRRPREIRSPWLEATFSRTANPTRLVRVVDRDLSTPYQDELALSFERELWSEAQIKLSYIRREFRDQLQDIDVNHAPGDFGQCQFDLFPNIGPVASSPGSGQTLVDPFTGETYIDTDPGAGDGRVDDCVGGAFFNEAIGRTVNGPDDFVDLYVHNPAWGDVLKLGNFNEAEYEAVVLELVRRWYRGWEIEGSYTWSTAEGDAESFIQDIGNDRALLRDTSGYLSYDQRHVVKVNVATLTRWGIRLGGTVRWESGLPYSIVQTTFNDVPTPPQYRQIGLSRQEERRVFPTGQRNDQRNPSYFTFDVRLAREFKVGSDSMFALTAEIFNLLNDDTERIIEVRDGLAEGYRRFGRQFQVGMRTRF
jgi:outer membrane receptor protein involved in Fe transport